MAEGFSYYVVLEYKGVQYRSDEMGPSFNTNMWNLLGEADKEAVARNYAFGINWRNDQFGQTGSAAIADYGNEITGWKAAGETWEAGIAERTYPELAGFFTGESDSLTVGSQTLSTVKGDLGSLLPETKEDPRYREALELINEIEEEFAAGKAIYDKLCNLKSQQVGNAIKAGSKLLIKDVIIDNVLVPNLAHGGSDTVASCIDFLKGSVSNLYEDLTEEPTIGEILDAMQNILDVLESTANALKGDIESKLGQLASLQESLETKDDDNREEKNKQVQDKQDAANAVTDATFSWSTHEEDYKIPIVDASENPDEFSIQQSTVIEEAYAIKAEFEGVLQNILTRKHDIYFRLLNLSWGRFLWQVKPFEPARMCRDWPKKSKVAISNC